MKKMLALTILITVCSCSIVPTSWTTGSDEQRLVRENTIQSIEFYRRCEVMKPATRKAYLIENIKYNMLIEEIICGNVSDGINLLMENVKKEHEQQVATKPPEPKSTEVKPTDGLGKEENKETDALLPQEKIKQEDITDSTLQEPKE